MKISLVQFSPVWKDPSANRDRLHKLLARIPATDLIVLPEMFSTGFVTEPAGIAEKNGESLQFMKEIAAARDCAVAGSLAVETEGAFRNRFYFVYPDGSEVHYDKHHLFTYGGEHHTFAAGEKPVVADFRGVRILLQVCYDLRFPVFSRNRLLPDGSALYDLALYVASWPDVRTDAWDALLKARAIENQCFLAGVNRVGTDPGNRYSGHSVLLGPKGQVLARCKDNEEELVTFEIQLPELLAFRNQFPVLRDAD
ncbi:MAG: amidohydrolase [Bacteroidales bacterium]|nr:amidohydrolase [Bacteroidales bacterium]